MKQNLIIELNKIEYKRLISNKIKLKKIKLEEKYETKIKEILDKEKQTLYKNNQLFIKFENSKKLSSGNELKTTADEEETKNLKLTKVLEEKVKYLSDIEKVFQKKTEELLFVKLKEKKCLIIIKKNEILSNQISSLTSTLEKYKERKEKLQIKEDKLYNKIKKETKLNESLVKKNNEILVYFRNFFI